MVNVRKLAVPRHCFLLLLLLYLLYLLGNLAWQELLGGRQELLQGGQELLLGGQELLQGGQKLLLPHQGQVDLGPVVSMASVEEGISEPAEHAWVTNNTEVILWIDLPTGESANRLCLQEYSQHLILSKCLPDSPSQVFLLSLTPSTLPSRTFSLLLPSGKCLAPSSLTPLSPDRAILASTLCPGVWNWTLAGQLRWQGPVPWLQEAVSCGQHQAPDCSLCPRNPSTGQMVGADFCHGECSWDNGTCKETKELPPFSGCPMCLAGVADNSAVTLQPCSQVAEAQLVEVGSWKGRSLRPRDPLEWRSRQDRARLLLLEEAKIEVTQVVEKMREEDVLRVSEVPGSRYRRAVVFYLDTGRAGVEQLLWWLQAWRYSGLDEPDQAFDVVVMVNPQMVAELPPECSQISPDFTARYNGSGRCWYRPYLGISQRDHSYGGYMNSQECLVGPGTDFLAQYKILLRADIDTFPTPRFRNFWPEGVLVDKHYSTNFNLRSIKFALKEVACEAGLEHHGWYNPGSTWYGDAVRVRQLARLTVVLSKLGRAHIFGPGTACRCADCAEVPEACTWSKGPYPGVLLLYMQEVAVNSVLTQAEWDSLPSGLFDQGVSGNFTSVCGPALLHCFHNAELFSKLAFAGGHYLKYDMTSLDLTLARDYATYMALVANGQGSNSQVARDKLKLKIKSASLHEWCESQNTNL